MNYFKYISIVFFILYTQICVSAFLLRPETNASLYFITLLVIMIFPYCGFYFLVRWLKLDLHFLRSNRKFKILSLVALLLLPLLFLAGIYAAWGEGLEDWSNRELYELIKIDLSDPRTARNIFFIIIEITVIASLFIWFVIVSVSTLLLELMQRARRALPSIMGKGNEIAGEASDRIKKAYEESNIPLRKKVKREKLLAELAELTEVEPKKRTYQKTDFQSKTEDTKKVDPLERQLRIKQLKKKLENYPDES